jgi:tetratricopeptide (TPR) repeat protein
VGNCGGYDSMYKKIYLIIVTFLYCVCLHGLYLENTYFSRGIENLNRGEPAVALSYFEKAKDAMPIDGRPYSASGEAYLILYSSKRDKNYLNLAKEEFEKAIQYRPTVASNYAFLADIYRVKGNKEEAQKYYRLTATLAPYKR